MNGVLAALGRLHSGIILGVVATALAVIPGAVAAGASAAVTVGDVPDPSWRVNGRVYAVEIVGDTVFVGGAFTAATSPSGQTVTRRHLAAFDADTGAVLDWRADAGSSVRALVSDGTWLYVGGAFGRVDGQVRSRLAKVGVANAALDPTFHPSFNDTVRALDLDATSVYVGGLFTSVDGVTRHRVAKVSAADGALDRGFVAHANGGVWGMAKNPATSAVYVSGPFSAVNGVARNGVAALSSATGATTAPVFSSSARPTLGLAVNDTGTRLFTAGGTGENAAAAWNTSTGARLWRQFAMGDIQAIEYHDGTVYFGFHDGYHDDTTLKVLAADEATGAVDPDFRPHFNRFWGVFAIGVSDDVVVVGGDFTVVSGVPAEGFARFVSTAGADAADEPQPDPPPGAGEYVTGTTQWRYWDRGTRPAAWTQPGFDSSSWAVGRPEFGYGDGDETTVVSYGPRAANKHISTYFRTTFDVPALPDAATIQLLADDGAAVYLNGVEVARDNLPVGPLTNTTLASSNRSGGEETRLRSLQVPASALHAGTNTIAVEVHQDAARSSDLSFDLRLSGEVG